MYKLRISGSVRNLIKKLPPKYRASAIAALEDIKSDPRSGKQLRRELQGKRSYQFGPYRLIYKIGQKGKVVDILKLGHRRLVYN